MFIIHFFSVSQKIRSIIILMKTKTAFRNLHPGNGLIHKSPQRVPPKTHEVKIDWRGAILAILWWKWYELGVRDLCINPASGSEKRVKQLGNRVQGEEGGCPLAQRKGDWSVNESSGKRFRQGRGASHSTLFLQNICTLWDLLRN